MFLFISLLRMRAFGKKHHRLVYSSAFWECVVTRALSLTFSHGAGGGLKGYSTQISFISPDRKHNKRAGRWFPVAVSVAAFPWRHLPFQIPAPDADPGWKIALCGGKKKKKSLPITRGGGTVVRHSMALSACVGILTRGVNGITCRSNGGMRCYFFRGSAD